MVRIVNTFVLLKWRYIVPKKIICGIRQGSILGPLLFLLYINANDTQIFSSSNDYNELIDKLNSDLKQISDWLASNKLQHHLTKLNYKYMIIGSSYIYNPTNKVHDYPVFLNNKPFCRTSSFECLGVLY
jgi:hypothetical protein